MPSPREEAESCLETGVFVGFSESLDRLKETGQENEVHELLARARQTPGYYISTNPTEHHGCGGVPQLSM